MARVALYRRSQADFLQTLPLYHLVMKVFMVRRAACA